MPGPLSYGLQTFKAVIGTPTVPVLLTTLFTGRTATLITSGVAMITFYIQYTAQTAANSVQIEIDGSPITTNEGTPVFYQDVSTSVAAGVAAISPVTYNYVSADTAVKGFRISYPCADQSVKISAKETLGGGGTAGTISIEALIGPNN